MNVSRLLEFTRSILARESQANVQKRLGRLDSRIQEIINSPQAPQHQQEAMQSLQELKAAAAAVAGGLTPPEWEFLGERGMQDLFGMDMVEEIEARVASNGITPAVAKAYIAEVVARRAKVLETFKALAANLSGIGFEPEVLKPGEAEIGFTIPRGLFENEFGGLVEQLKVVDRIVDIFTEAVTGEWRPARVSQVSTSDPLFLLQVGVPVAIAIGGTVTWLLDTYERTLRIRKLKAESQAVGAPVRMLEDYEQMIKKTINEAIDKRIAELRPKGKKGREQELENGLRWAMEAILSRVERGMRVEVRFLPPVATEAEVEKGQHDQQQKDFVDLARIQQDLNFPIEIVGDPILAVPGPAPAKSKEKGEKKARKPRKSTKKKDAPIEVAVMLGSEEAVDPGRPNGEGTLQ